MPVPKTPPSTAASWQGAAETASSAGTRRWRVALLCFAAFVLFHDLWALSNWQRALSPEKSGTLGVSLGNAEAGGLPITAFSLNSALEAAGAKVGDHIRFDHPGDGRRSYSTEETIGLTLNGARGSAHLEVRPFASGDISPMDQATVLISWTASLLMFLVGMLIGMRRAESVTMRMLSASLLSQTMVMFFPLLPAGAFQSFAANVLAGFMAYAAYVCFLYFVLAYTGMFRWRAVRIGYGVAALFDGTLTVWSMLGRSYVPYPAGLATLQSYTSLVFAAASMVALVVGWARSAGAARERLAWLCLCMGAIYTVYFGSNFFLILQDFNLFDVFNLVAGVVMAAANAGLGYAVLRHRILDFGFAVNRALVYGTTSLILAALFILAAQLVNRVIAFEGRNEHVIVDVAIGLCLALVGRQIARWVDPRVQRIFFGRWHAAAAKLAQFGSDRIHGIPPEAIRGEFLQAVRGYTGAQSCAIYIAREDGTLRRRNSTMEAAPEELPGALVTAMRAEGKPQRLPEAADGNPAVIAIPMLAQGSLVGALLVGPKPEGASYRHDEIAHLAASARQVGVELELRRLRQLEAQLEQARPARRRRKGRAARMKAA